jgi:hypothetical protein
MVVHNVVLPFAVLWTPCFDPLVTLTLFVFTPIFSVRAYVTLLVILWLSNSFAFEVRSKT